jgi:hypothetical protein
VQWAVASSLVLMLCLVHDIIIQTHIYDKNEHNPLSYSYSGGTAS